MADQFFQREAERFAYDIKNHVTGRVRADAVGALDWLWTCSCCKHHGGEERAERAHAHLSDHKADSTVSVESLPRSVDQLRDIRDRIATTPEGGALVFILALINYTSPDNHDVGTQMCTLAVAEDSVVKSQESGNLNGYVLHRSDVERLNRANAAVAASYVIGTSPENNYALQDGQEISIGFRNQEKHAGSVASGTRKVFVWSTGADTARPIKLKRNIRGIWKVCEFSSLVVGVRAGAVSAGAAAAADAL